MVTFFLEHSVVGYYPTYSVLYAVVLYGVTAVSHVNAGVSASFQISSLTVGGMFYTLALICLLSWVTWLSVEPGRPLHGPAVARRMNVTRRRWLWYAPSAVDFRYHDEFARTSDVSLHCFVAYPRFLSCVSWQLFTSVAMLTCSRLLIILCPSVTLRYCIKTRDGFEDSMFEAKAKASDHDCWKK